MTTEAKKLDLITQISLIEDVSVIDKLIAFLKPKKDWWEEISEAEKNSIQKGISEADAGDLISYEKIKKEIRQWV
jgi:predicted transcriptional regulator